MVVTFEGFESYKYVEVRQVTKWKDGCVFQTVHKGYAIAERPKKQDELYCSLSTSITRQNTITLNLIS